MTNSLPPDPERRRERDDEQIAVFVALAAIGTIIFWGVTRGGDKLSFDQLNPLSGATDDEISEEFASGDADKEGGLFGLFGADADRISASNSNEENESGFVDRFSRFNPFRNDDKTDSRDADADAGSTTLLIPPAIIQDPDVEPDVEPEAEGEIPVVADPEAPEEELTEDPAEETAPADPIEPVQAAIAFSDVSDDFWAKPFIDSLSERAIISGFEDNSYQPEGNITRAQFAASIQTAFADESTPEPVSYIDVTSDYWANAAIQKATEIGFMTGYPENDFRPENNVTKLEILVALVTGLNLPTPSNPDAVLQGYQDRDQIPDWAVEKIAAATEAGLVVSYPDTDVLAPNKPATRAEASAMIYQALLSQDRVPAIDSEFIVTP